MSFAAFLLRRLLSAVGIYLGLVLITFAVYWALPATPAFFLYPNQIHLTDYQIAHANQLFGLQDPKLVQVWHFLWRLVHGDIGKQWNGAVFVDNNHLREQPIGPSVYPALRVTLSIILGGAVLVLLVAVPLGAFAGARVGSLGDRVVSTGSLVGICTHPMVLGSILSLYLGFQHLNWLPGGEYCPFRRTPDTFCGGPRDWFMHLLLPWLTFALIFLALYTRMVRASVSDTLHEEFVRTARAKGASELRIMRSHVLPSAGLRVLTMVGMEVGTAIGVCIYIETAYGMYGLGRYAVSAMGGADGQIDLPFALAIVTLVSAIVLVGNLVVDVLYAVLDPRTIQEPRRRTKTAVAGVF